MQIFKSIDVAGPTPAGLLAGRLVGVGIVHDHIGKLGPLFVGETEFRGIDRERK